MAPTQPFKPRALKVSEGQKPPSLSEHSRTKHAKSRNQERSRRSSKHRSTSPRSKSRGEHKRAKRDRKYDVAKKLDVELDKNFISGSEEEHSSKLNLDTPMYSIGEYLNDRTVLVRNMFESLKKDTLTRMIPSILRDLSLKELEEKCVFELKGMSRKRARAILSGQDLRSSSERDDSEDEAMILVQPHLSDKVNDLEKSPVESPLEVVSSPAISSNNSVSLVDSPVSATTKNGSKSATIVAGKESLCMTEVEPTEMELVELELRAQALRAMMRQLDQPESAISPLPDHVSDTEAVLEQTLITEEDMTETVKLTEKDFFEIHVDEEELADFQ